MSVLVRYLDTRSAHRGFHPNVTYNHHTEHDEDDACKHRTENDPHNVIGPGRGSTRRRRWKGRWWRWRQWRWCWTGEESAAIIVWQALNIGARRGQGGTVLQFVVAHQDGNSFENVIAGEGLFATTELAVDHCQLDGTIDENEGPGIDRTSEHTVQVFAAKMWNGLNIK
jgi:hypothetical protein